MGSLAVPLERETAVAIEAVQAAGEELRRRFAIVERMDNPPANVSTDADRASQEIILSQLHRAFPADRLCGEENTPSLAAGPKEGKRCWIVDPIDGTRGFVDKSGEFSIMVGLVDDGDPVLGFVLEPLLERLTWARKGSGCFIRISTDPDIRARVTPTEHMGAATMGASRSQKSAGRQKLLDGFGARDLVTTFSAGIKLAQVARGDTDLYLGDYLTLKDWDVCAGHLLVTEAGGGVTSVDGDPIRYDGTGGSLKGRGILATNGRLHPAALACLKSGRYRFE
jgi:3'(2'), 5'-bisphosphate nucleotidase